MEQHQKTLQSKQQTYENRPRLGNAKYVPKVSGHPRLLFTDTELHSMLSRLDASENVYGLDYKAAVASFLAAAEQMAAAGSFSCKYYNGLVVEYPVPPTQPAPRENPPDFTVGRYPFWTAMGGQIKSRLETLSLAYALSGEQRFAAVAVKDLLSMTGWEVWSDPTYNCGGNSCLDSGYIVEGVATAYDLLYSVLSPAERAQVRNTLLTKGLKPMYEDTDRKIDHNIHMVRTAALGYGALALLGEEPELDCYVRRACENFLWYLDQRLDSGQMEGLMYTSVSMNHIAIFAESLARVTGDLTLFMHPFVKEALPRWVIYFQGLRGSGLVNFSDGSLANYFFLTMAAIGRFNKHPQANWYVASPKVAGAHDKFLHADPDACIAPPDGWPTSAVFADIGWAALRSGWSENDTLLAFLSSGSRLGHNHFDQNHFVVNVAGTWLVTDPGYQDYQPGPKHDVTLTSLGHNTLLINGKGQKVRGGGHIVGQYISPQLDYVVGDASHAYADALAGWTRQILYVKPGYYLVLDEIELHQDSDVPELLLHPGGPILINGLEVSTGYNNVADPFTIVKENAQLHTRVVWPPRTNMTVQVVQGAEVYGQYISFRPAVAGKRAAMVTLLQPSVNKELGLSCHVTSASDTHICLTVEQADARDYVWLSLHTSASLASSSTDSHIQFGQLETDGLHAIVNEAVDGTISGYILLSGSKLAWQGRQLVDSSCEISGSVKIVDSKVAIALTAAEAGQVQLWLPGLDGLLGAPVTVELAAGANQLELLNR